ncbi:MAG: LPXTG cell wall anchor domain-containing protein [Catenulispora sp.]|nr:LPXTG cell wall anchor domain-containing protein [Catenulispora sp.]
MSGAVAALVAAGAAATWTASATAQAAPAVPVTVDAGTSLGTVPATGVGMNTAVYDSNMNDPAAASLLKAAGIQQLRYPGGSYGDGFHWKTNTMTGGGYVAANTDFDHFMATANAVGAQPILIANYGSGSPEEAADWVKYANVDKHYGVKYWEIGNEIPGNGHYGSKWEIDQHSDTSPKAYATNLVAYAKAMKAVDPSVKIGAVLTTPGGWPDGITGPGDQADWNHTVLSIAANSIDFVIVHWYPGAGNGGNGGGGGTSAAAMLQTPENQVASMSATVHSLLATYAGSRASSIPIAITETASGPAASTSQAAALFAPDAYMTWFEHGAFNVDWWDLHNGPGQPATIDGQTDYMDGGVLSSGGCNSGVCEPALETPFASYWGIRSISTLAAPGGTMVKASSGNPLLAVHAVRTQTGGLNVMLINKDPANAVTASLSYAGFTPAPGAVTTVSYLKGGTALTTAQTGTAASQTLPPYSIMTLQLKPVGSKGGTTAPATGAPSSAPAAAPSSLRSFPAAGTPGTPPTRHSEPGSQSTSGAAQGGGATTASPASGNGVAHDAQAAASTGPLAHTGASSTVLYATIGSVVAIAAGSALMVRRRKIKAGHRR